jgi:F0F1-type ATP synthase beta subunit
MLNLEAWAKTASLRSTEAGRERILNDEFAQTSEQALYMIYTIDEVKT